MGPAAGRDAHPFRSRRLGRRLEQPDLGGVRPAAGSGGPTGPVPGDDAADPKRRNINGKLFGVAIWVCPLVSLLVAALMYNTALGAAPDVNFIITLFLGVLLLVIGNYLPKCRSNYTVGIKLPWTLHDEANWTYTHRLAGKVWTVGAVVVLLTAFLWNIWILIAVIAVLVLVPAVASYLYYRKYA